MLKEKGSGPKMAKYYLNLTKNGLKVQKYKEL